MVYVWHWYECVHMCWWGVHVCVKARGQWWSRSSSMTLQPIFWNRVSHSARNSLIQLGWPANEFPGFACLCSHNAAITHTHRNTWLFMLVLGTQVKLSYFNDRHFTNLVISPTPSPFLYRNSLCSWGWHWLLNVPSSTSKVLGSLVYVIMPRSTGE